MNIVRFSHRLLHISEAQMLNWDFSIIHILCYFSLVHTTSAYILTSSLIVLSNRAHSWMYLQAEFQVVSLHVEPYSRHYG